MMYMNISSERQLDIYVNGGRLVTPISGIPVYVSRTCAAVVSRTNNLDHLGTCERGDQIKASLLHLACSFRAVACKPASL